jgi:hypothetical protein
MILDIEKLITQKNKIITDVIDWQKTNYPKRTTEYEKCRRDIAYVIDAYVNDLTKNTTTHTIGIANKFWVGNTRQIKTHFIEIAIHDYMISYISKNVFVDVELIKKITALKNIFIGIIKDGPIKQLDFLEITQSMQHCQRNFDLKKSISNDVVNWLYEIGYSTPTKQNLNSFQIVAFTQRNTIFEIAKTATSLYDAWEKMPKKLRQDLKSGKRMQNPQVNANLLFMFFLKPESRTSPLRIEREGLTGDTPATWRSLTNCEIGISSSAIALAANSIGLKTGFCRCFDRNMLSKVVEPMNLSPDNFSVALGVGYPMPGWPHFTHTNKRFRSDTFVKEQFTRMIY